MKKRRAAMCRKSYEMSDGCTISDPMKSMGCEGKKWARLLARFQQMREY